jgi:integrase/recombinase XerD
MLQDFLAMLSSERGAAKNTLAAYARDLDDYLRYMKGDATPARIRDYLETLSDLKPVSVARKLSSIKQYHRFLYNEGLSDKDPASTLKGPKKRLTLPKVLTIDETERLLQTALSQIELAKTKATKHDALRTLCLLELVYATGLRVSELVALPRTVAVSNDEMVRIKGKGGKERLVPLHTSAKAVMSLWLTTVEVSPWLFPANSETGHLSRQQVGRAFKSLASQADIAVELSPHVLRHAFASHLVQGGADLRVVQTLLGHSDISTTQIYTHFPDDRLMAMVRDLHPLNQD